MFLKNIKELIQDGGRCMNDQWLSIVEYARCFQISDMTVRRRIKTGRLHAVLKDGKYYIPLQEEAEGQNDSFDSPVNLREEIRTPNREFFSQNQERRVPQGNGNRYQQIKHVTPKKPQRYPVLPNQKNQQTAPYKDYEFKNQSSYKDHESKQNLFKKDSLLHSVSRQTKSKNFQGDLEKASKVLPQDLVGRLHKQQTCSLDSSELINFCAKVVENLNQTEKTLKDNYKEKFDSLNVKTKHLETEIKNRELKLNEMKQKVEDLILLVKMIESKNKER